MCCVQTGDAKITEDEFLSGLDMRLTAIYTNQSYLSRLKCTDALQSIVLRGVGLGRFSLRRCVASEHSRLVSLAVCPCSGLVGDWHTVIELKSIT